MNSTSSGSKRNVFKFARLQYISPRSGRALADARYARMASSRLPMVFRTWPLLSKALARSGLMANAVSYEASARSSLPHAVNRLPKLLCPSAFLGSRDKAFSNASIASSKLPCSFKDALRTLHPTAKSGASPTALRKKASASLCASWSMQMPPIKFKALILSGSSRNISLAC